MKLKKEKQYDCLQPKGKFYCLQDLDYNVLLLLLLGIDLEGWIPAQIRIWPNEKNARKGNIFCTRSPSLAHCSPVLSSTSKNEYQIQNFSIFSL